MSDHTHQNLGRTHWHTCSTLVGTPALAQPARALVLAFGQVCRAPLLSAVPARAYKSLPGRASLHPALTITGQPPLLSSGELFSACHCHQSLDHRGQPTPATPKSSQCFG
jgi:hypothetical protein